MKIGMNINDTLNSKSEEVQTFKKAEEQEKLINKAKANQKKAGRPTKTKNDVKKKRVIYYSDIEFQKIGNIAKVLGLSETELIKSCVDFFVNLEELGEATQIAKAYNTDLNSLLKMFIKREVKKENI